jgi:hypothetical protein
LQVNQSNFILLGALAIAFAGAGCAQSPLVSQALDTGIQAKFSRASAVLGLARADGNAIAKRLLPPLERGLQQAGAQQTQHHWTKARTFTYTAALEAWNGSGL